MEFPKTISFVIDVSETSLFYLKKELADSLKGLDVEDAVYTYHPENEPMIQPGQWTKQIMDYKPIDNFNLRFAIKEAIDFCGLHYEEENSKHIFVFLEFYTDKLEYEIKKAFDYELNNYDQCYFHVFGIGNNNESLEKICFYHPRCEYEEIKDIKEIRL